MFHTLWVNTPLSRAQGIQWKYSPRKYFLAPFLFALYTAD